MGGGGKGSSKNENQDMTQMMSKGIFGAAFPAFEGAMGMFTDAVNTGQGPESRQPIYSQAMEKSMQASNQAQVMMGEDMAMKGLSGTPFEEQAMREIDQQGRLNARNIPMQMENADYWKVLQTFFPGAQSGTSDSMANMNQLTGYDAMLVAKQMELIGSMFATTMGGIQSLGKGGGGGGEAAATK